MPTIVLCTQEGTKGIDRVDMVSEDGTFRDTIVVVYDVGTSERTIPNSVPLSYDFWMVEEGMVSNVDTGMGVFSEALRTKT